MTTPYLDDRELESAVHEWLHSDDGPAPDRAQQVEAIVATSEGTGQRHRWWPLLPLQSGGRRRTGTWRGGTRPAPLAAMASVSIVVVLVAVAILVSSRTLPPSAPGSSAIDLADRSVIDRLEQLWAGQLPVSAAADVYAEDAVHTVVWTDEVERFVGIGPISARLSMAERVLPGMSEYHRLPDGRAGEHRYLDIALPTLGVPCVLQIAEDRVERHDCIFPITDGGRVMAAGPPPDDVDRAELEALIYRAWDDDQAAFDEVVSPDIEHRVAFDDGETLYDIDEYRPLAMMPGGIESLAPSVRLPAPADELRWTDFNDVAGGSLCTFWARDGLIVRHDCVVPSTTP